MENFHTYRKIKIIGDKDNRDITAFPEDEIVIEEKIDGANFRFMYYDGNFIFGSRKRELSDTDENEKAWKRGINHIKTTFKKPKNKSYYNHLIFYGECCIKHSTPYDFEHMPPFLGFDVMDLETNSYMEYKQSKKLFEKSGLVFVPIIKVIKVKNLTPYEDRDVPKSKYYDGQAEGVVFKNYNNQIFAKYVTAKHREENKKSFGGHQKWAKDDTEKFVAKYCTNARIDKKIFELIHEGNELEMRLMSQLPTLVFEDIREEHYKDILDKKWKIDVGKFRKEIATRCLMVLKMMITNSLINKGE